MPQRHAVRLIFCLAFGLLVSIVAAAQTAAAPGAASTATAPAATSGIVSWPPAPDPDAQQAQQAAKPQAAKPAQPSLQDLGISPAAAAPNPQEQARLDRRSHMLQIHQRLGLITGVAMLATVITAGGAKQRHGTPGGRALHATLGGVTTGLYAATAYYAIAAPKIHGVKTRGPIRAHKFLAWVHGTGMVLTPILGSIAYAQINRGERVHGIARYHGVVAITTVTAYAAAIASVSIKF